MLQTTELKVILVLEAGQIPVRKVESWSVASFTTLCLLSKVVPWGATWPLGMDHVGIGLS